MNLSDYFAALVMAFTLVFARNIVTKQSFTASDV